VLEHLRAGTAQLGWLGACILALGWIGVAFAAPTSARAPIGMQRIPAGEFLMGSSDERAWADEQPAHRVMLSRAFYIDQTEVTNAQFQRFVAATSYRTVAERPTDVRAILAQLPPGAKAPPTSMLEPGSLVFVTPVGEVNLRDLSQWWKWTPGANWRRPLGPGSNLKNRGDHPAVHLAWEDAQAYCRWAGKRLPTEAEWERAARGGVDGLPFVWGSDKPTDTGVAGWLANIWQGVFPTQNTAADGYAGVAPVRRFKPNPYGLYDMAGNVWEWTADWYDADVYASRAGQKVTDPSGPPRAMTRELRRTQRGGSFLCHESYCSRYRPGARQGAAADSATSHAGVRCAKSD
jgi:formylglycine-generating enzyme